ncbi:Octopine dehydrogenase [Seminavis robusta]|uniref:Octopine dehydrogenase n=1 Tax=Seminavis robusta TaxID=568900 RepID=A0A9N8E5P1_9STRA|nr:Octopine dehydrogenase [Seminavis robusta]|eukprot:Sro525_g160100.1 Octopine dehydrogenase (421) ;mRNA; f:14776-16146
MSQLGSKVSKGFLTICGGGNSTLITAALAKSVGWDVAILTRRPEEFNGGKNIGFINNDKGYLGGQEKILVDIDCVTRNAADCIPQSTMVMIAGLPVHLNKVVLNKIKDHLNKDRLTHIGSICSYGGFDWIVQECLGDTGNYSIFGTQLIPYCCGTKEYGKLGDLFGAKDFVRFCTVDGKDRYDLKEAWTEILRMPLYDTDFLTSILFPNNPVIHAPILYGLFAEWDGVTPYDPKEVPEYVYRDLRTRSGACLQALDDEVQLIVQELRKAIPKSEGLKENLELGHNIVANYGDLVRNTNGMDAIFMSNLAYAHHKLPYIQVDGGVVPDVRHKFFETDLPFGLIAFKDFALMVGVETPLLDEIIYWNQRLLGVEYMVDGKLTGKDILQCSYASKHGLGLQELAAVYEDDGRELKSNGMLSEL